MPPQTVTSRSLPTSQRKVQFPIPAILVANEVRSFVRPIETTRDPSLESLHYHSIINGSGHPQHVANLVFVAHQRHIEEANRIQVSFATRQHRILTTIPPSDAGIALYNAPVTQDRVTAIQDLGIELVNVEPICAFRLVVGDDPIHRLRP